MRSLSTCCWKRNTTPLKNNNKGIANKTISRWLCGAHASHSFLANMPVFHNRLRRFLLLIQMVFDFFLLSPPAFIKAQVWRIPLAMIEEGRQKNKEEATWQYGTSHSSLYWSLVLADIILTCVALVFRAIFTNPVPQATDSAHIHKCIPHVGTHKVFPSGSFSTQLSTDCSVRSLYSGITLPNSTNQPLPVQSGFCLFFTYEVSSPRNLAPTMICGSYSSSSFLSQAFIAPSMYDKTM